MLGVAPGDAQTRRTKKKPVPPAATAVEQNGFPVERINIEGNHNYTRDQILTVAGLKVGQTGAKAIFEAARERLLVTGAFESVGFRYAPSQDAKGYDATLEIVEVAQAFPLLIEELPVSEAEVREYLGQKDPLFGARIAASKTNLQRYDQWMAELLATKNYKESIHGKLTSVNPPEVVILYRPGNVRPSVAQVKFTNTGDIPPTVLQTPFYGVAAGTIYTEYAFRQLLDNNIRPIYEARGRLKVSFPKIDVATATEPGVKGVIVTVQVDPGPIFKLAKIGFSGGEKEPEELYQIAKLKAGETANFDLVKEAQERIVQSFRRNGYLHTKTSVTRQLHDAEKTADIVIHIEPGRQFTFSKLWVVGLDLESEPVVRKLWGLKEGKPFNPEYPDHFLSRVKEEGIFDNLKSTVADSKINEAAGTVDVALTFK
jgi:outer membrane protein insertion porin family